MAGKSRTGVQTILCRLEKGMLGLFREKKGSGVVGLCCEAAGGLTCVKA